jgi:hypothetical protein
MRTMRTLITPSPVRCLAIVFVWMVLAATARGETMTPIPTAVVATDAGFELHRGGRPFFVRGVGGTKRLELLREIGGNALRTWGADDLERTYLGPDGVERKLLDHAHALGLAVAVGFWMEHPRKGFDYADEAQVSDQLDRLAAMVKKYKDHPAVLVWGIGNEVEIGADAETTLRAMNDAAKLVKSLDPHHPTMTVVAEIGDGKAELFARLCPDIDILGINSYGGLSSLPERLESINFNKPYLITEFGPLGHWETGQSPWRAPYEQTSTEKAEYLRHGYEHSVSGPAGKCLGGFAFLWGHKQETTATWYGMFLDSGEKLAAVDVLASLWSGKPTANASPSITPIRIEADPGALAPNQTFDAVVTADDAEGDALRFVWIVRSESTDRRVGGDAERAPPEHKGLATETSPGSARVRAPADPGAYRLFVYAYDGRGNAATANIPFLVVE